MLFAVQIRTELRNRLANYHEEVCWLEDTGSLPLLKTFKRKFKASAPPPTTASKAFITMHGRGCGIEDDENEAAPAPAGAGAGADVLADGKAARAGRPNLKAGKGETPIEK